MTKVHIPKFLAGPIVRRCNVNEIAIWLVSSSPVDLSLLIEDYSEEVTATVHQLQVGERCFIYLLHSRFHQALRQEELGYKIVADGSSIDFDIKQQRDEQGYTRVKIPNQLSKIAQGSCRKPHSEVEDALPLLNHLEWSERPELLILSGDQIYADDVSGAMLDSIHQLIAQLGLYNESLPGVNIQDSHSLYQTASELYGRDSLLPQTEQSQSLLDFFASGKKPIFTSHSSQNHLITRAEFIAMYLLVWSDVPWNLVSLEPTHNSLSEKYKPRYIEERKQLELFRQSLPEVRALLSNTSTLMIFDDHDISDDWNLNRQWEENAYGHDFSRRIISNGLYGYFICQGWGNDPASFEDSLLKNVVEFLETTGDRGHFDALETTLLQWPSWHYTLDTTPPIFVMDTRTQRWRSEKNAQNPSGLLDWEALSTLQDYSLNHRRVIWVSAAPVFGVKLIETIQRVFTWFGKSLMVDAENWMAHRGAASTLLNIFGHRNTPDEFIILSGDVHYSFVFDATLKKRRGDYKITQFTASGFKNQFPTRLLRILDVIDRALFGSRSPLNWLTKRRRLRIKARRPSVEGSKRLVNQPGVGLIDFNQEQVRYQLLVKGDQVIEFPPRD